MSRRRFFGVFFGILGAALLTLILYIAFADLGRHKARIEAFVTKTLGRPFAIEGPLKLKLFPVIDVSAAGVRLGNVPGGSRPQMVEIGSVAVQIGVWSLISGPPDVRSFELHDATVLLEQGADGKGNWIMGPPPDEDAEEDESDEDEREVGVPLVIRSAHLNNVRVIYHEAKKPDLVVELEKLSVTPGQKELLAMEGHGMLDVYPMSLKGEMGPLKSLLRARDMQVDMKLVLGKLTTDIDGFLGRLDPLDGADLTLKIDHPQLDSMLQKLNLPVIATGPLQIEGRLKDASERTQLDFNAKVGDLTASVAGTLKTLSLVGGDLALRVEKPDIGPLLEALKLPVFASGPMRIDTKIKDVGRRRQLDMKAKVGDLAASVQGTLKTRGLIGSDLKFEATAADAARLAKVFEVNDVPALPLTVSGHAVTSRKEMKFDSVSVAIAEASVRADGSMKLTGDHKLAMNFKVAAASLKKLRETLPELEVAASGAFETSKDRHELKNLQATLGKTQVAGSLLLNGKQIEAQISSPRLDLTPFFPQEKPAEAGADGKAPPKTEPPKTEKPKSEPPKKFVFGEEPLPLVKLKQTDAKLHVAFGELVLGDRSFKDLDGNLAVADGQMTFNIRAAGANEGTLEGTGTLVPASDGTADLDLKIDVANIRAGLGSEEIPAAEMPPLGLTMNIKLHGSSPRQMAAGANGQVLLTQGSGRTKSGFVAAFGGDFVKQLAQKLNPFAKEDPFMKLDCTVARADIVNGQLTLKPLLMQSEKVTVTAHGTVDLHTEKLLLDFNTSPRKGIGVSPGMFTNPLIRLEGTMASPRMGLGAKGVASGALAAATGGATVIAGGFIDRMKGEKDLCAETLALAKNPPPPEKK